MRFSLPLALVSLLSLTSQASGQSFNIDVGSPNSVTGGALSFQPGAAGQAGHWNLVHQAQNWQIGLRDLQGQITGGYTQVFQSSNIQDLEFNSLSTAFEGSILDDWMDLESLVFFIGGLESGTYDVYTYSWAADSPFSVTRIRPQGVLDATSAYVGGADFSGVYTEGVTHSVHRVDAPYGEIKMGMSAFSAFGSFNGMQLVKVADDYPSHCSGNGEVSPGCTPCPCSNDVAPVITGGCLNSAGESGFLRAYGLPTASGNELSFYGRDLTPNSFAILVSGANLAPTSIANPCFGLGSGLSGPLFDGLRCVALDFKRHGVRATNDAGRTFELWGGEGSQPAGGIAAQGNFTAGMTRYFQIFYRDDPSAQCGTGQNTTQAVEITFQP